MFLNAIKRKIHQENPGVSLSLQSHPLNTELTFQILEEGDLRPLLVRDEINKVLNENLISILPTLQGRTCREISDFILMSLQRRHDCVNSFYCFLTVSLICCRNQSIQLINHLHNFFFSYFFHNISFCLAFIWNV